MFLRGIPTESSHKSNIWPDIPSELEAFLGFKFRTSETILFLLIEIWSILLSVRKFNVGNVLLAIDDKPALIRKKVIETFGFVSTI